MSFMMEAKSRIVGNGKKKMMQQKNESTLCIRYIIFTRDVSPIGMLLDIFPIQSTINSPEKQYGLLKIKQHRAGELRLVNSRLVNNEMKSLFSSLSPLFNTSVLSPNTGKHCSLVSQTFTNSTLLQGQGSQKQFYFPIPLTLYFNLPHKL